MKPNNGSNSLGSGSNIVRKPSSSEGLGKCTVNIYVKISTQQEGKIGKSEIESDFFDCFFRFVSGLDSSICC